MFIYIILISGILYSDNIVSTVGLFYLLSYYVIYRDSKRYIEDNKE